MKQLESWNSKFSWSPSTCSCRLPRQTKSKRPHSRVIRKLIKSSLMSNSWLAETLHGLGAKRLKAGQSLVGLQQDTRTVLSLFGFLPLKIWLYGQHDFPSTLLNEPRNVNSQGFWSCTRVNHSHTKPGEFWPRKTVCIAGHKSPIWQVKWPPLGLQLLLLER